MKIGQIFALLNGDKLVYCYCKEYYAFLHIEKNEMKVYDNSKSFHEEYKKRLKEIFDSKYDESYLDGETQEDYDEFNEEKKHAIKKFEKFEFIFNKHGKISVSIPVKTKHETITRKDCIRIKLLDRYKMDLCLDSLGDPGPDILPCEVTYIEFGGRILFRNLIAFDGQIIEFSRKNESNIDALPIISDNSKDDGIHINESGIFLVHKTTNTPLKFIDNVEMYKFMYYSLDIDMEKKIGIANSWFIDSRMLMNTYKKTAEITIKY